LKDFKKYYIIPATPEEVYLALTTEITLQLWTGDIASFDPTPGTEFTLWDGSIIGKNLEFDADGQNTSLEVRQTNIPDEAYADIAEGWTNSYAASLQEFYEED
jgi:activator of HSP90 ATPase